MSEIIVPDDSPPRPLNELPVVVPPFRKGPNFGQDPILIIRLWAQSQYAFHLISHLQFQELLFISGLPMADVRKLERNIEFKNNFRHVQLYTPSFWQTLKGLVCQK